jgi:hypothetical protein
VTLAQPAVLKKPSAAPLVVQPKSGRRSAIALVLMTCAAAIGATIRSSMMHALVIYGDARAHLNVARHVTDGLRTGLTQLGSVWLPLPHVLLAPLVAIRPLWHSGAAGAIVGGLAFVYTAWRIYGIVDEVTGSRLGAWVGAAAFACNLNMLYVQSTALTEPVLLAFLVGGVYHLCRWMRTLTSRDLAWAGTFVFCATLTRYEGWALLVVAVALVPVWSRMADGRASFAEANLLLFSSIAGYGIVLWLLYNAIIFGSPFYFLNSAYSAQAINGAQAQFGLLGTKGSISQSLLTYGWDVVGIVGPILLIAGGVGAVIAVLPRTIQRRRTAAVLLLLLAPVLFEVLSLYAGQTTIRVPQLAPHGMWNDRYGLMALPFCAVAVGAAVGRWRPRLTAAFATAALVSAVAAMGAGTPLALADGRHGTSSATAGRPEIIAAYLHTNYAGGEILADDSVASPLMFAANLDLKQFLTVGFHPYWEHALLSPVANVQWLVEFPGDSISTDMHAHPDRFANFQLVLTQGVAHLYERVLTGANSTSAARGQPSLNGRSSALRDR